MPPLKRVWTCSKCKKVFTRNHSLTQHQQRVCRTHAVGGALPRASYRTFTRDNGVVESQSVWNNTLSYFTLKNEAAGVDLPQFLENKRAVLKELIADQLERKLSIKCNLKVDCVYNKLDADDATYNFKTCNEAVLRFNDLDEYITEAFLKLALEEEEAYLKDSGLTLKDVVKMTVKVSRFMPLEGSQFLELPEKIKNKKATISPLNYDDDMCSKWCLLAPFAPSNKNRPSELNKYEHLANFSCLSYPTKVRDFYTFERRNKTWSVNVFALDEKDNVYAVKLVDDEKENHRDLLLITNGMKSHYCLITNFSRLIAGQTTKHKTSLYVCKRCQSHFYSTKRLQAHKENCWRHAPTKIVMPKSEHDGIPPCITFKNWQHTQRVGFAVYADFEAALLHVRGDDGSTANTKRYQEHVPFSYAINVVSTIPPEFHGDVPVGLQFYRGPDSVKHFIKKVSEIGEAIAKVNQRNLQITMSAKEQLLHEQATQCYTCKGKFSEKNPKVADHCHLTSKFRGSACSRCNLRLRNANFVPIVLHNLSSYDGNFIIRELGSAGAKIEVIANSKEKFISFSKSLRQEDAPGLKEEDKWHIKLRFLDSFRFLASSLDTLAQDLQPEDFKEVKKHFSGKKLEMAQKKAHFCYDYVNHVDRLNVTEIPPIKEFYNRLTDTEIDPKDYDEAKRFWDLFECKTLGEYSDWYLIIDTLLLSDVFETFRDNCLENYQLDAMWYYTLPSFSWDSCLKMTGIELELLTDPEMLLMIEKGIRGGLTVCTKRYETALNQYVQNTPTENQSAGDFKKFLMYYDALNLYGAAMCSALPSSGYKWINPEDLPPLEQLGPDDPVGYILECDIEYPQELHFEHNDLPFCPETMVPPGGKQPKLMATLNDKKNYVIHYRNLQQAVEHGLRVTKVHRVLQFYQIAWIKPYIMLNTKLRTDAKSNFARAFFKLLNNAIYGKTMENKRLRINLEIVTCEKRLRKLISQPDFLDATIISDGMVAVHRRVTQITFDKPITVGFCVLELSKTIMYAFHYDVMRARYGDKIELLYMDTDSLTYCIRTDDYYKDKLEMLKHFDTSDYPKSHPCYSKKNIGVLGKFKDELKGVPLQKFVGLRAKMYAMQYEETTIKKAKGVKKYAVKRQITFEDYVRCLMEGVQKRVHFNSIRSYNHVLYSIQQSKIGLSPTDDKRYICLDNVTTLAHGHVLLEIGHDML